MILKLHLIILVINLLTVILSGLKGFLTSIWYVVGLSTLLTFLYLFREAFLAFYSGVDEVTNQAISSTKIITVSGILIVLISPSAVLLVNYIFESSTKNIVLSIIAILFTLILLKLAKSPLEKG